MKLRVAAPAKVNLALEVLGRRPDGFHDLLSVVQLVDLADVLEVEAADELTVLAPEVTGPLASNLVYRAATTLRAAAAVTGGARLSLQKRVPVGAGLGGGSSDAAATLRALARLWRLELSTDQLADLAARLGSDVPLFLDGGASLLAGRGERITPLPPLLGGYLVLVTPPWTVERKTPRVYEALSPEDFGTGQRVLALARELRAGRAPRPELFANGLWHAARRVMPELGELQHRIEALTGLPFALSGAGPSLFHYARDPAVTRRIAEITHVMQIPVRVCRPLQTRPAVRRVSHQPSGNESVCLTGR